MMFRPFCLSFPAIARLDLLSVIPNIDIFFDITLSLQTINHTDRHSLRSGRVANLVSIKSLLTMHNCVRHMAQWLARRPVVLEDEGSMPTWEPTFFWRFFPLIFFHYKLVAVEIYLEWFIVCNHCFWFSAPAHN